MRLPRGAPGALQQTGAVMEGARARIRLAECLADAGDRSAAELELEAAEAVLANAGATGHLMLCERLRARLGNC